METENRALIRSSYVSAVCAVALIIVGIYKDAVTISFDTPEQCVSNDTLEQCVSKRNSDLDALQLQVGDTLIYKGNAFEIRKNNSNILVKRHE